jgi:UTP--glucose-1-phosphate uridylyltransferase
VLAQMTDIYAREGMSMLAVQEVPKSDTRQYGIVSATPYQPDLERINAIVESRPRKMRRPRWPWWGATC